MIISGRITPEHQKVIVIFLLIQIISVLMMYFVFQHILGEKITVVIFVIIFVLSGIISRIYIYKKIGKKEYY